DRISRFSGQRGQLIILERGELLASGLNRRQLRLEWGQVHGAAGAFEEPAEACLESSREAHVRKPYSDLRVHAAVDLLARCAGRGRGGGGGRRPTQPAEGRGG